MLACTHCMFIWAFIKTVEDNQWKQVLLDWQGPGRAQLWLTLGSVDAKSRDQALYQCLHCLDFLYQDMRHNHIIPSVGKLLSAAQYCWLVSDISAKKD